MTTDDFDSEHLTNTMLAMEWQIPSLDQKVINKLKQSYQYRMCKL